MHKGEAEVTGCQVWCRATDDVAVVAADEVRDEGVEMTRFVSCEEATAPEGSGVGRFHHKALGYFRVSVRGLCAGTRCRTDNLSRRIIRSSSEGFQSLTSEAEKTKAQPNSSKPGGFVRFLTVFKKR